MEGQPPPCPCCASWNERRRRQAPKETWCAPTLAPTEASHSENETKPTPQQVAEQYGDFFVLQNAQVFTLDSIEEQEHAQSESLDVWVGGGKIWALTPSQGAEETIICPNVPQILEIDAKDLTICPGFVDFHQHVTGGGGEAGFASRTPPSLGPRFTRRWRDNLTGLQPLHDVLQHNPLLRNHMVPTHMDRSEQLVQEGMEWMNQGGCIDFSGWLERQRPAIGRYHASQQGRRLMRQRLSISSDSFGSINVFDNQGKLVRYSYGLPKTHLRTFMALVYEEGIPVDTALRFFCRNPASILRLDDAPTYMGRIHVGGCADLLVLKLPPCPLPVEYRRTKCSFGLYWPDTDGVLQYVIAGGRVVRAPPGPSHLANNNQSLE